MAETPLDRLKTAATQIASWAAFANAVVIGTLIAMDVAALPYEATPKWVVSVGEFYGDFWNLFVSNDGRLYAAVACSPILWLILWITTGSPRFLPWKK